MSCLFLDLFHDSPRKQRGARRIRKSPVVIVIAKDRNPSLSGHNLENRTFGIFDLGIRFISVQDQVDTESPIGKAMFTVIGTMAELESSLISERVKAGMEAAKARGKLLGRPATPPHLVARVETLAQTTEMSIRQIKDALPVTVSRSVVGHIVKRVREQSRGVSL
jgi:DNA invertase Pin-like site-specific DNA recombinase